MAHVTSGSRITSIHEVSVICRGTLSGSTISTDGNPNYLSKSSQYLLRSLYIHVTGNDYYMWASGDSDNPYHQRPKVATGLRANMILVLYPGLLKSDRYLLKLLYVHVTGSNYYIWANGDASNQYIAGQRFAMGISSSMTLMFYPTLPKSSQYLLKPTMVRFIINISSS